MERIINMTEASAISESDYIVIDSPTLGTRKYLAANLAGGGGGGDTPWNSIYLTNNQDTANATISSEGWYKQQGAAAPMLSISNTNNLTMYGKTKYEAHLRIKTLSTLPSSTAYILGGGSLLSNNSISLNTDHTLTFSAKNISYTTTATLSADTEYIIDFIVDVTNSTISYSVKLTDDTVVESNSYSRAVSYDNYSGNWQVFSNAGNNKMEGEIYLPESYIKIDDVLIWGTA